MGAIAIAIAMSNVSDCSMRFAAHVAHGTPVDDGMTVAPVDAAVDPAAAAASVDSDDDAVPVAVAVAVAAPVESEAEPEAPVVPDSEPLSFEPLDVEPPAPVSTPVELAGVPEPVDAADDDADVAVLPSAPVDDTSPLPVELSSSGAVMVICRDSVVNACVDDPSCMAGFTPVMSLGVSVMVTWSVPVTVGGV